MYKFKYLYLIFVMLILFSSCKEKKNEFARDNTKPKTPFTMGKLNERIYSNAFFGFEIEYPKSESWIRVMEYDKDDEFYTSDKTRTLYPLYSILAKTNASVQIWAEKPPTKALLIPLEYARNIKGKRDDSADEIKLGSPEETLLAGQKFIKLEVENITRKGNLTYYIASKGDYLYYIMVRSFSQKDDKGISKILDTLKFE